MSESVPTGDIDLLPPEVTNQVADLARRTQKAEGPMMQALNRLGGRVEAWTGHLPASARDMLNGGATQLLSTLYHGAAGAGKALPPAGAWGHRFAAAASGAAGGAAGLASAVVELPATVMLMFGAMQRAASENGFDPQSAEVKLICLEIFGSGGPSKSDDAVNTSFLGSRLAINGSTVQAVITRVAPAFTVMLGRQLASKAVPIIGAVAGAGVNYVFTDYYQEIARVRFGLKRLAVEHGEDRIAHAFRAEMARRA